MIYEKGNKKRGKQLTKSTAASQDVPEPTTQRKSKLMIARKRRKRKVLLARIGALSIVVIVLALCIFGIVKLVHHGDGKNQEAETTDLSLEPAQPPVTTEGNNEYIFAYNSVTGEPCIIDWEGLTDAWAREAGFEKRYTLTDAERYEIAQVITAEAVGETMAGKMAIAQCILQAAEDDQISPVEVLTRYKYSGKRPEPCQEALTAVMYVFDFGIVATTEPIKYFYNPDLVTSTFHESQTFVVKIGHHAFYSEKEAGKE